MLNIICGRAGSGKSRLLFEKLGEYAENSNRPIYLIVPRQYSFECDRSKLEILGNRLGSRIEVLSFKRLYETLSGLYETNGGKRLNDSGRRLIMISALKKVKPELVLFKKQAEKADFCDICLNFYSNLKRSCITVDMLEQFCGDSDELLCRKLSEAAKIVRTYEAMVEGVYLDADRDMERLHKILQSHRFFEGAVAAFDGFSNFSAAELKVISQIFGQTDDIFLSVCCDDIFLNDQYNMFYSSAKTARQFKRFADLRGIRTSEIIKADLGGRFDSEELSLLEKEFLNGSDGAISNAPTADITLYAADTAYDECEFVASEIRRLIDDGGYRYSDICVISRNEEQYGRSLYTAFKKYGIPVFYDFRKPLIHQPLTSALVSALNIARSGCKTDEIMNYLKCGFSPFDSDSLSMLESYCYVWSIDRDGWLDEWTLSPQGYSNNLSDEDREELARLNEMRAQVLEIFSPLRRETAGKNSSREISKAVYGFIRKNNLTDYLSRLRDRAKSEGDNDKAALFGQVYVKIIDIINQMATALSDIMIDLKEYIDSFVLVCKSTALSNIPTALDEVSLGEAGKVRPVSPKVTFTVGANYREFPLEGTGSTLLTASEREKMQESGLDYGFSRIEEQTAERFIAYTALTAPSEKLYVSYKLSNESGEVSAPSVIVTEIERIFPSVKKFTTAEILGDPMTVRCVDSAAERLAYYINREMPQMAETAEALKKIGCEGRVNAIENAVTGKRFTLSEETAGRMYKGDIYLSPTRFESFNHCAFGYFCRYGLNVRPLERAVIDNNEKGSITHYVLERVLADLGDRLADLGDDELKALISDCVDGYVAENMADNDMSNGRRAMLEKLKDTVFCVLCRLGEELAQSEFKPTLFEAKIADDGIIKPFTAELDDGSRVCVIGTADRIDTANIDGIDYVRVIDYKTGRDEFKLSDIPYGLNSQMVIYLYAFIQSKKEQGKCYHPAGVFYMPAGRRNTKIVEVGSSAKSVIDEEYCMKGIPTASPELVKAMDKVGGKYIKNRLKNDGTLNARQPSLTEDEWNLIGRAVTKKLKEVGNRLKQGCIEINPLDGISKEACKYCDFIAVCGNDPEGNARVPSKKTSELIDELSESEVKENGD